MLIKLILVICIIDLSQCGFLDFLENFGKLSPTTVISENALEHERVVLSCNGPVKGKTRWYKLDSPSPKKVIGEGKVLKIPRVSLLDRGMYMCQNGNGKNRTKIFLTVHRISTPSGIPSSTPSWYTTFGYTVKPNTTPTSYKTTPTSTTTVSSPKESQQMQKLDVNFQACENSTSENNVLCQELVSLFECNDGQKVNRSLRCNRKRDCYDGSDEQNCEFWSPKITTLPESKVELFCGTDGFDQYDMLKLECEFVGHPEPLIKWKKYEGHVPSKCQQISKDGHGILLCPNFDQSDQGAYSCVAENSGGSSESQPKSIAKCKNSILCNGFRVKNDEDIEHCLSCYCSGKSSKCQNIKSKLTKTNIRFPRSETIVYMTDEGDITFIASEKERNPGSKTLLQQKAKYCELSKDALVENSLLKSYGRNMRVPKFVGKVEFLHGAPSVIIQGNGVSLYYVFTTISPSASAVDVRFWPGNWHHLNKTVATREDIMLVLSNIDRFLFRCEYKKEIVENWGYNSTIELESSSITDLSTSVSYVEKCTCPEGYVGLSCESCATGYKRIADNSGFVCEKIQCNSRDGFFLSGDECVKSPCNVNNSVSMFPDYNGKCKCKEGITGDTCNITPSCELGYFRDKRTNECLKCWCNGVTNMCNSSTLYKSEISSMSMGGYNSSNGRNFWLLPSIFGGNRLKSYGGHIKYALKYSPGLKKQNEPLSVELLTVNEVTYSFTHPNVDRTTTENEKTFSVPMKEYFWKKDDKSPVNRSEFLTALTKIKAVYVESPYHLSSGNVSLIWVRMSDASEIGSGELASEVEQCACPVGYKGLSCESCAQGYYKEKNFNRCIKCDCDDCDPIEGCLSCPRGYYRENPENEIKPICQPCNCNGREEKCGKDTNNNTYCICKNGFTGLQCENMIVSPQNSSHLLIKITPSKLTSEMVGTLTAFNCSYESGEKLKLSYTKVYRDRKEGPFPGLPQSTDAEHNGFKGRMNFTATLDEDLLHIECLVHSLSGLEVGRVLAVIQSTGIQPVKITNCYSDVAHVKETKSKDLICQAIGSPKPTVTWYLKTNRGLSEVENSTDGVYSLEAVTLGENGTTYVCEAKNSIGDVDTCSVVLIVEKNCDVVHITPKLLTVEEGDNIHLQCRTTADSSVAWSRRGNYLFDHRTFQKDGNLTILNATIHDTGNYSCTALTTNGKSINQTAWVNVTEKWISPNVSISSNDVTIFFGENFETKCFASGKPTPRITWSKISGQLAQNIKINKDTFKIKSATFENSGIYECEGRSAAGRDISRIFIEVKDSRVAPKLEVSQTSLSIAEGKPAKIECLVMKGNPPPVLYWAKEMNGQFVKFRDGSLLEFYNITHADRGVYQCVARNSVGQDAAYAEIDVMFVPRIKVSEEEITVHEYDEITVKCSAVGNPRPKLMWKNLLQRSQKRDTEGNDVLADLYLTSEIKITLRATSDLYGLVCIATNSVGESRKEVNVRVLPEFVAVEKDVHQVRIGSYHELICSSCPGQLKWEKLRGSLVGDECEIPNGIMIPSVQIQHNATYICRCDADPKYEKSFEILVYGFVPKFTQEPKSYIVLPVNLKSTSQFQLEISFKMNEENGLLLKDENDEFVLYIHNNKVVMVLTSETGKSHHFKSTAELEFSVWYLLVVDVTLHSADISIFGKNSIIVESKTEHFRNFTTAFFSNSLINFFIGGAKHSPRNIYIHHSLPKHIPSFDGCISRLTIDQHTFDFVKEGTYSENLNLCMRCSETVDPCEGKGKCLDAPTQFGFICICPGLSDLTKPNSCPPSCIGRGCNRQPNVCDISNPCHRKDLNTCINKGSNLECRCALEYKGLTCEKENQTSFCVNGNGFVRLSSTHLLQTTLLHPEIIEIHFSMDKSEGLLLWRGNHENHLLIGVRHKKLEYIYKNQDVKLNIQVPDVHLKTDHNLFIKRLNDSVLLTFDSKIYKDEAKFTTNRVSGDIYLGGAPNHVLPKNVKYKGLTGCIHHIAFGGQAKINFRDDVLEALNVKPLQVHLFRNSLVYDELESESEDSLTDSLNYY